MSKFVKVGGLHIRPDDVLLFRANPMNTEKTTIFLRNGEEWNVTAKADDVAKLLNDEPSPCG